MREHYVYLLSRPDGTPCYIGKGKGHRLQGNIRASHNPWLARIVSKAGGSIPFRKIVENVSESEAFELERFLIHEIGRGKNGPLVNLTDGGDGVSGWIQTPEQLAKLIASRRGRRQSEAAKRKLSEHWKGREFSDEHRAAISAAKKGKSQGRLSEAHRDALRRANLGKRRTGKALEAIRRGAANMSAEARALKGQRVRTALTGKRLSESHRASISRVQRGRIRSPEFRAKVSAGMRAYHGNAQRDARIFGLRQTGAAITKIAVETGLSEAGVWSVLHRMKSAKY